MLGSAVDVPDSPVHLQNSTNHFVHGIKTGEPYFDLCQDRLCRDAQEILEAGRLSAETGEEISLPLPL